ncbi:ATP phosphoribosyltransferase regulatory subunit [Sphingomonas morindae]|uniref:ATP phosphoribosyltransferase regulatory subunit n=1 Tax=Sphingomonas morindae TaxID=1541170 RepID=A0ABY4XAL2_9SPHN|nr:ATP phosphoribosyltransferase regulatory subunit [Sphingomonas morindae]USI74007.1 ATP phosphoribosyltransferase regulatory subunit [Sphingomonas morindae]
MTNPALLPEGLRDRLPPEAEALGRVRGAVLWAAEMNGYARVEPPLAEFETTIARGLKSSRPTDLLRMMDPISQRTLALRPDITAQVGRIAATRLAHAPRPLRLCYAGQVLKVRGTQLRPEREMCQAGCELVGSDSVAAAIEAIRVALDALTLAGAGGFTVDITLPDLVPTLAAGPLPLPAERLDAVIAELDGKDAGALAALGAEAYLPLIEAAGPVDAALARLAGLDRGAVLASRLAGVRAIVAAIGDRARITLDPTERHGFEYQSWIGFSLFVEGARGEIGRGGSYTILHPDGHEEPATGFSLYLDPLVAAGLAPSARPKVFLAEGYDAAAADRLHGQGYATVAALSAQDDAARLGCAFIWANGALSPVTEGR